MTRIEPGASCNNRVVPSAQVRSTQGGSSSSAAAGPSGLPPPQEYNAFAEANNSDDEDSINVDQATQAAQERQFEECLAQRGLEMKRMLQDGNCLFRAVADRVYGDPEVCAPCQLRMRGARRPAADGASRG